MTKPKHRHPHAEEIGVFWIPSDRAIPMEYKRIGNNWRAMGALVDGYISVVRRPQMPKLACGCGTVLVVDEEATLKYSPLNPRVREYCPENLFGDVLLVGEGFVWNSEDRCYESDFISLPPEFNSWQGPGSPFPSSADH